jgi:RNA polymerase sigma-70 factor (ECF subfamily)
MSDPVDTTELLLAWNEGDQGALNKLMPLVYDELRRLAQHYLRGERADHTLQPTALVHEAWLRLVRTDHMTWQHRAHFIGVAAEMMRRILVDHARQHRALIRGGGETKVSLDEARDVPPQTEVDVIALDDALNSLSQIDPRQNRIVELKYFGGLEISEIAEVLGISPATVKRDWAWARAWLHRELSKA